MFIEPQLTIINLQTNINKNYHVKKVGAIFCKCDYENCGEKFRSIRALKKHKKDVHVY